MNGDYFHRSIPEPFRILGLQLKPLSLGRYRLMKRHNIAFVAEGPAQAKPEDLILGVLICSQKVDDFAAWFELPPNERAKDLQKWGRRVCPPRWKRILLRREVPDLIEKIRLFKRYIEEQQKVPMYWDESGEERSSGAHWSHSVEVCLRSQVGWSREEINEEPLGKALADYFKFAESQGAIRIMTDAEIEQGEQNAKIMQQLLNN